MTFLVFRTFTSLRMQICLTATFVTPCPSPSLGCFLFFPFLVKEYCCMYTPHFLAGSKKTNSLIFKYDKSNESFSVFQEVETNGAEGVATLNDGDDYWIAFANGNGETYSRIYRWSYSSGEVRRILHCLPSDLLNFSPSNLQ